MRYLLLSLMICSGLAQAAPLKLCELWLRGLPVADAFSEILRRNLNDKVTYFVRMVGGVNARLEFDKAREHLQDKYAVKINIVLEEDAGDGRTDFDIEITGLGRNVAQALLEFTDPKISGSLAQEHPKWLIPKSLEPVRTIKTLTADELNVVARMSISDLNVSRAIVRALHYHKLIFLGDVAVAKKDGLRRGRWHALTLRMLHELEEELVKLGLRLEMEIPGWPFEDIDAIDRALASESVPALAIDAWLNRSTAKNLNFFGVGFKGISEERPTATLETTDLLSFGLVNLRYFKSESAAEISDKIPINFVEVRSPDTSDPHEWSRNYERRRVSYRQAKANVRREVRNWKAAIESFRRVSIDEIEGEKLSDVLKDGTPIIVVPPAGSIEAGSGAAFIILPSGESNIKLNSAMH